MPEGGFLVKYNGKEVFHCYKVAFDFDEWQCKVNAEKAHDLPQGIKTITLEVEVKDVK